MEVGIEAEFAALFLVTALGSSLFDKFEVETPAARKLLRWALAAAMTLGTYLWIGHWALAALAVFAMLGISAHVIWCRTNGIHPLTAEPRLRYYELRGWKWPDR